MRNDMGDKTGSSRADALPEPATQSPPSVTIPIAGAWEKSIFPISRKVPVPSDMSLNRKFYPWTSLGIGDSFFVRGGKVTAMSAKAAWAGRQYGKQYVCRTVRGGVRVWCVGDRDPKAPRKRNKRVLSDETAQLPEGYDAPLEMTPTRVLINRRIAQGIEARRAETGTGSVHESPVGNADAPNTEAL
jgi:hypothetical protein